MNSNASLMGINKRYAIFAICNKEANVFNHKVGPFLYINQFNHCTHLIRIPLRFFVRLGKEVGDLPLNVTFVLLSNTGRCGSTLLTQLFEEMPNAVSISEPEVLMEFSHEKTFDKFPNENRYALLQSCIRLLFHSARQSVKVNTFEEVKNFLIKPKAHGISIANDLFHLYPNIRHLYMYRHPAEYVRSIRSLYKSLFPKVVYHLLSFTSFYKWLTNDAFSMNMKEFVVRHIDPRASKTDEENNSFKPILMDLLEKYDVEEERHLVQRFAAMFCANILGMFDILSKGNISIHIVSYHELKDDTESCMNQIYKFCNIKLAENNNAYSNNVAATSLPHHDSQANSGISRTKLKSYQNVLTENEIDTVDNLLQHSGLHACNNFPLQSEKFAFEFGIPHITDLYTKCNAEEPDYRTSVHHSEYLPETPKKSSKDPYHTFSEQPRIHTFQASNKSIWLPINKFF